MGQVSLAPQYKPGPQFLINQNPLFLSESSGKLEGGARGLLVCTQPRSEGVGMGVGVGERGCGDGREGCGGASACMCACMPACMRVCGLP